MSGPSEEVRIIQTLCNALCELVVQVREDVPEDQATRHLWDHVEYCEQLLEENNHVKSI